MEFMNRGAHQGQQPLNTGNPVPAPSTRGRVKGVSALSGLRYASIALLFSATVLVVALLIYLVLGGPSSEAKYIEKDRMQAVFLNGGQVYFGKIKDLNGQYLRMSDIFYLRVNQVVQPNQEGNQSAASSNDISLVKLGCELHRPANEMLINREQIIFWENLKQEDGENTVPGAVKKYLAQYPNGQECQAQQAGQSTDTPSNITPEETTPPATTTPARR